MTLDPNHVRALHTMIDFYMQAPGVAGGDKAKAHAIADQFISSTPRRGIARRSHSPATTSRKVASRNCFARPSRRGPPVTTHEWRWDRCGSQKKFEEAEGHAREAVRLHADRAIPYGLLAVVLVHQDKWTDLDAGLVQSEKADPDNLLPYFRAGNNCLSRKVELPRAERTSGNIYYRSRNRDSRVCQCPLAFGAGA